MSDAEDMQNRLANYRSTISSIEDEVLNIETSPPDIDIVADVEEYARSLRPVPQSDRFNDLKNHVKRRIEADLMPWYNRMHGISRNSGQLYDLNNRLEDDRDEIDSRVRSLESAATATRERADNYQSELDRHRYKLTNQQAGTTYSKWTSWILLIGALLIGLLTAYYYTTVIGQIRLAQNGGEYLGMVPSTFTTFRFLTADPFNLLYIFGALIFLLAGKLVSIVYSNMGHPNWMMTVAVGLTISVIVGTVILLGTIQQETNSLQTAEQELNRLVAQSNRVDFATGDLVDVCSDPQRSGAQPVCARRTELEEQKTSMQESIAGYSYLFTIVVMLAEISVGSVAWMYTAKHYEQGEGGRSALREKIEQTGLRKADAEKQVKEHRDEITSLRSVGLDMNELQRKVSTLRAKVLPVEEVSRQFSSIEKQQIELARLKLQKMEDEWQRNSAAE